jgi:hypothetical protein
MGKRAGLKLGCFFLRLRQRLVHARQYCGVLRANDSKQAKYLEFTDPWVSSSSMA